MMWLLTAEENLQYSDDRGREASDMENIYQLQAIRFSNAIERLVWTLIKHSQ